MGLGPRASGLGQIVLVLVLGCSRRAPVESCADDLQGVWRDGAGARWMVLDHGASLEAYPLFADSVGSDLLGAPRVIDVERAGQQLAGTVHRRYEQRAGSCDARAPVHVTACKGDAIELVIVDPTPPISVAPCRWGVAAPSRVDRWQRE